MNRPTPNDRLACDIPGHGSFSQVPVRSNLVAQTVSILIYEIAAGNFGGELPGEFELCDKLQVSRTTVRPALQILERQGYVRIRPGKKRLILKRVQRRRAEGKRPVYLLSDRPLHRHNRHNNELFYHIMLRLGQLGHDYRYISDKLVGQGKPEKFLGQLCRQALSAIWILISCSAATQTWFYTRGYASFALGHLHRGVRLPNIDTDYRAVGCHAAGQLLGCGHQRIGLILPDPSTAGSQSVVEGFSDRLERFGISRSRLLIANPKWERDEISRLVDRTLVRPNGPTGLYVMHDEMAVSIYSFLNRRGVRIPADVSMVIGDGGDFLDHFAPDFTHYRMDLGMEMRRTFRILYDFVSQPALHPTNHLIMPDFRRGETIAAVGSSASIHPLHQGLEGARAR